MTDKQKIRAEIKRSMKACEEAFNICPSTAFGSRIDSYKALLSFIDSLPEEPVSKDLEEEIIDWCNHADIGVDFDFEAIRDTARHFAEWQKQQLMKDALHCSFIMHPNNRFANYSISAFIPPLHPAADYAANCDKVKIIIIKEEEK